MLYYETIDTATLELLEKLQYHSAFKSLRLVGGTALALQLGHRKSIDIDLFGDLTVDEFELSAALKSIGTAAIIKKTKNINIYLVNGIKVDIVNYPYLWLAPPVKENRLTMADKKDIAAMKLSAISGRGTKKDFIDFFFLLNSFSISEMLSYYKTKYHDGSEFIVLKSLTYFEDADEDEDPIMLVDIKWEDVKTKIIEVVVSFFS